MTSFIIALNAELPTTLGGWALVFSVFGAFVVGTVRVVFGMSLRHIDRKVDDKLEASVKAVVREAVENAMAPLGVRLDAIDLRLTTQDGELERVRLIEQKIENGLSERTIRIEDRQIQIEKDVAEIRSHLMWDGNERRLGAP